MTHLWRNVLVAVLAVLLLGVSATDAEAVSLDISSSWKMGDYLSVTNSSGVGDASSTAARFPDYSNGGVAWSAGRFQRSGVNFQVGLGLGPASRIAPYIGFGMNAATYKNDYLFDSDGDGDDETLLDQGAATQIGIEAGFRGFLMDRGHALAAPYIRFSFSKYIGILDEYVDAQDGVDFYGDVACAGNDDDNCGEDYEKFDEAMLSPQGFKFALGAEYYFNEHFAIGADLIGFELFWASGTNPQDAKRLSTYLSVAFYSTLNISFRFIPKARAKKDKPAYDSDYDFDYED